MKDYQIIIDGSEGGGQILRTSLALSTITNKPFKMINIRKARPKPGLQPQHLEAVNALNIINNATTYGAKLGSSEITFFPNKTTSMNYEFNISTAGSTSLLLHSIYLPLSLTPGTSTIIIKGGTHVPWSPTYDYLKNCWLWFMNKIGLKIIIELKRAGFYPHGGGIIESKINSLSKIKPITLLKRGKLKYINIYSAQTNLNDKIAARQAQTAKKILGAYFDPNFINIKLDSLISYSRNTTIAITAIFEHTICCYTEIGEKGKPAEKVAETACKKFLNFLNSNATLDEYIADQILLPLSLANEPSEFICNEITNHINTNIDTIKKFLKVNFEIDKIREKEFKIKIIPKLDK